MRGDSRELVTFGTLEAETVPMKGSAMHSEGDHRMWLGGRTRRLAVRV